MSQETSLTSLVYNVPYSKQLGVPPFYYRYRSCNPNFPNRTQTSVSGFTPAEQYQKLKLIQNTVNVYSSLYVNNLGSLTAYKKPINDPDKGLYGVCWNQMSDRPVPSVQKATVPSGFNVSTINKRHTSVTSSRPGCQTPGGKGCDIKHNSYDRYLNRIKGKGPMRRGVVPSNFGNPILFNPSFPIYGGKTMKTNIVDSGCDCPIDVNKDIKIYNDPLWQPYPSGNLSFNVGDYVYAIKTGTDYYSKAIVTEKLSNNTYVIKFDDNTIQTDNISQLRIYFPCNCTSLTEAVLIGSGFYKSHILDATCSLPITTLETQSP